MKIIVIHIHIFLLGALFCVARLYDFSQQKQNLFYIPVIVRIHRKQRPVQLLTLVQPTKLHKKRYLRFLVRQFINLKRHVSITCNSPNFKVRLSCEMIIHTYNFVILFVQLVQSFLNHVTLLQ